MPSPAVIPGLHAIADFVGVEFEKSPWFEVSQERIDAFASATDDDQWIHTDVERARRESPWKETIAHGYLTLSLAPALLRKILHIEGSTTAVNTGIEKLRLSSPVLAGSRVRLSATIKHARELPNGAVRVVFHLTFEVEGSAKPACTADVVYAYFP
ncbi:MAG: MaoC family dehydratase [Myxococcota bacterium]